MLYTTVLSLGVLPNCHNVNICIQGLEAFNGFTWSDVGIKAESSAKTEGNKDMHKEANIKQIRIIDSCIFFNVSIDT